MMIIPQSVAVSLPLDVPKFDVTPGEVVQSGDRSGLKIMLQAPCDSCKIC